MNANHIRQVLTRRYGSNNATCIAFEVAHGTGRHANRHVDAVVMDLWPSRGLTLHAMEIKVSVSDLKRELADGAKAEEIAQHCDLFSLVTPKGLVSENRMNEIPRAWGLIEVDGNDNLIFKREAKKTKARSVDRLFMAAMLRAMGKPLAAAQNEKLTEERTLMYKTFNEEVERKAKQYNKNGALWDSMCADLKADGLTYVWETDVRKAVAFVLKTGVLKTHGGIIEMEKTLRTAADAIKTAGKGL